MKVSAGDADRFCQAPPANVRAMLVYGPDEGLVRERAKNLVVSVSPDPSDPFRVADLTGPVLDDDPARLVDEAAAMALTGGRRVVRIDRAGDKQAKQFSAFLKDPVGDSLIVVLGGDLPARSSLRKVFESAKQNAAAIACYKDNARSISQVVRETLTAADLKADPDALAFLTDHLGGDRQVTRRELEKLALYKAGSDGRVTLEDVLACVGDTAELTIEDVTHAVAEGNVALLERSLSRSFQEGVQPTTLLRAVARHLQRLHLVTNRARQGEALDSAIKSLRPPVFWKVAERFQTQARSWNSVQLATAMDRVLEAEIACKRTGAPAMSLTSRGLYEIAAHSPMARRKRAG